MMKRTFLISMLALLMALPSMAQHYRYRYHQPAHARYQTVAHNYHRPTDNYYGLRVGVGVSTVNSDDRYLDASGTKTGLNLGLVAGFQMARATPVYLETGLLYAGKGAKADNNGSLSYSLDYLEVPLLMKYRLDLDRATSLQPFIGVFGAVGVGGQVKDSYERLAYSSFDDDGFQRFDGGLRIGCGLQFDMIYIEGAYEFGLANICDDTFDTSRNRCFYVNCGVNF
jgi:hypothetical protein